MAGALSRGINARRKSALLQRAFYTDWKKMSGMKCQTLNLPNGMYLDVYGPLTYRRSDSRLRRMCKVEHKLKLLQIDNTFKYCAFGDRYQRGEFMYTMNCSVNLTNRQKQEIACPSLGPSHNCQPPTNDSCSSCSSCSSWSDLEVEEIKNSL